MTIEEANRARAAGIRIYAIGVGPEATQEMLDQIANQPSSLHTFRVDQFKQLDDIIKRVSTATCQVVAAGTGESSMSWSHCQQLHTAALCRMLRQMLKLGVPLGRQQLPPDSTVTYLFLRKKI